MTESPETPQAGIAQAVGDLSQQTRNLVRHEVNAAQREMLAKARQAAPAFTLVAASAALGLLAAASGYRLTLRLLEKRLPPAAAALAATLGYGAAAAGAGVLAARQIRQLPPLFPAETVRQASRSVAEAADEARARLPWTVDLVTKPLDPRTWPDFARLAEDHHGVWAGCWCLNFHAEGRPHVYPAERRRQLKEARVREGRAHAALVYDGSRCVGWCQFGPTDELPRIKHQKAYRDGLEEPPDWRITCFFVGRTHRGRGVADAALAGAIEEIGRLGGGMVESYPEDTAGRKPSGSFLYNATVALFERHGFKRMRQIGKHHWVVSRFVG